MDDEGATTERKIQERRRPAGIKLDSGLNFGVVPEAQKHETAKPILSMARGNHFVKPFGFVAAVHSPKILKPIPITNKVFISFDDDDVLGAEHMGSIEQLTNPTISFSETSRVSSHYDETNPIQPESEKRNSIGSQQMPVPTFSEQNLVGKRQASINKKLSLGAGDFDHSAEHTNAGCELINIRSQEKGISQSTGLSARKLSSGIRDIDSIPPASIQSIVTPISRRTPIPINANELNETDKGFDPLSDEECIAVSREPTPTKSLSPKRLNSCRELDTDHRTPLSTTHTHFLHNEGTHEPSMRSTTEVAGCHQNRSRDSTVPLTSTKPHQSTADGPPTEQKTKGRKQRPKEHKRTLYIFDRKKRSEGSYGSGENPWFQATPTLAKNTVLETDAGPSVSSSDVQKPALKEKRTKLSKISRAFKGYGKSKHLHRAPSSSDTSSIPSSASNASSVEPLTFSVEVTDERLGNIIQDVVHRKKALDEVLNCMMHVYSRPAEDTLHHLYKYFATGTTMESSIRWITEELRTYEEEDSTGIRSEELKSYRMISRIYRAIVLHVFASGAGHVKRAFLNNTKMRSALLDFFEKDAPRAKSALRSWTDTSAGIFRLFNSFMVDHSSDLTVYISNKPGLLHSIVRKHVSIPEASSFIAKLCAADALSESTQNDLRYGAPNTNGILLLVKEKVLDALIEIFVESCTDFPGQHSHMTSLQRQSNSLWCLKELSIRAATIPKFGKNNCSFNGKLIKRLNTGLDSLTLYSYPDSMRTAIDQALAIISGSEEDDERPLSCHERNNPLTRILSLFADLLGAVLIASESKNIAIRRTVGRIDVRHVQHVLLSKVDALCEIVHRDSANGLTASSRLSILRALRCLFASSERKAWDTLSASRVSEHLLDVLEENRLSTMTHKAVLECVEASMKQKEARILHKQWVQALGNHQGWLNEMKRLAKKLEVEESETEQVRSQLSCVYIEITSILINIAKSVHCKSLSEVFEENGMSLSFMGNLESAVLEIREAQRKSCGGPRPEAQTVSVLASVESLAARLNDVNAV
ncbi:hypothetical protein BWQ96_00664 [Gracilariopsis chorda]|uniref:Uncharacterized protein n=1 Tax=Gracilariopsis chorda TaxID=448386 RepID=A0A2V3J5E2_9FLOR|nr:hypothetical protein BWQ96_00664 [Gracilariopsis chorda]|eukprot:PXF49594.1 hypothetical protein BWQ96_00664 [Gracilariopsis chorda]